MARSLCLRRCACGKWSASDAADRMHFSIKLRDLMAAGARPVAAACGAPTLPAGESLAVSQARGVAGIEPVAVAGVARWHEKNHIELRVELRFVARSMAEPIRYYDRYARTVKTEQVFGERWLRFAYENPGGRFFVWLLARRAFFSKWYGYKMNKRASALQILPFISKYGVDVDEFAKSPFDYKTFNEFFYRALKPGVRPIATGDNVAVFPADGRHLAFQDIQAAAGFYVKGAKFSFAELLGSESEAERFAGGAMLISRLCPVDYHRFHFPVGGVPGEPRLIEGWLYSVSPVALRRRLRYLIENKRVVTLVESATFGTVAVIEVGATNVGSIQQSFVPGRAVAKGEEKGLFAFGGSCVITVFQHGRVQFDADILEQSAAHLETYAKMGDRLGTGA